MGQASSSPSENGEPLSTSGSEYEEYESEEEIDSSTCTDEDEGQVVQDDNDEETSQDSSSVLTETKDDISPLKNDNHVLITEIEAQANSKREKDLTVLTKEELTQYIARHNKALNREDILETSRVLDEDEKNLNMYTSYHSKSKDGNEIPLDSIRNDKNDKTRMDVAALMNEISSDICNLRFKMVPARLSEVHFWNAIFCILEVGKPDKSRVQLNPRSRETTQATSTLEEVQLKQKLKLAEQALEEMRQEMIVLKSSISTTINNPNNCSMGNQNPSQVEQHKHNGRWIMDKESEEFFNLEPEVKAQLREQKTKRLREVKEQMKFILDSDDISATRGKWECCKKTTYYSEGC